MPLGLAFCFAMVGISFEDWLPHNYYYSNAGNLHTCYLCLRYFVILYLHTYSLTIEEKIITVKKYLCVHMRTRILADRETSKKSHKNKTKT